MNVKIGLFGIGLDTYWGQLTVLLILLLQKVMFSWFRFLSTMENLEKDYPFRCLLNMERSHYSLLCREKRECFCW